MPNSFLKVTASTLAFCSSVCASASAQDKLASPDPREPVVVVTANRTAQPVERVGQSITVVDSAEIERRQTQTVADVLRTLPGVSITRNGGVGTSTSVYIRGAESDHTVALVDGIKLNDPSSPGGGFNFGNLLTGNIERIEVLRGPSSVLWGSQAIGGVINMITRQPTEELTVNLRSEYGYRDTGQIVGNIAGKAGPLSASVGAGYFRTDGISAFSEARGGVEKDGYKNYGANGNFNLALSDGFSVDARGWYSEGRVNIDGFPPPSYAFGDVNEESRTREFVGYTGINAALFDGRFRNRLGYAYTDTRRRNISLDGPATETFAGNGRNERIEYQGIFDISDGWQLTGGLERETSRFSSSSYGAAPSIGRARIDSVYGQIIATPVIGLTLTGPHCAPAMPRGSRHPRCSSCRATTATSCFSRNGRKAGMRGSRKISWMDACRPALPISGEIPVISSSSSRARRRLPAYAPTARQEPMTMFPGHGPKGSRSA